MVEEVKSKWGNNSNRYGPNNPAWRGGRYIDKKVGYVYITLQPDDPFFSMANSNNCQVLEHRLVMAKHLGRCLTSDEVVDHLGTKYPDTSFENKSDNRIENLRLTSNEDNSAQTFPRLYARIDKLERENQVLAQRVLQLEVELTLVKINECEKKATV